MASGLVVCTLGFGSRPILKQSSLSDAVNPPNTYITSDVSQASLTDKSDDYTNSRPMPSGQSSYSNNEFASSSFINNREGPRLLKRELYERSDSQPSHFANGNVPYSPGGQQPFGQSQPLSYMSPQDNRAIQSLHSTPERQSATAIVSQQSFASPSVHWPPQDTVLPRRPGPFDPEYPTSRNTVPQNVVTPAQPAVPQVRTGPSAAISTQSPWFASAQAVAGDAWGPDPSSLTAANLGQHNKQQERQQQEKPQSVKLAENSLRPTGESGAKPAAVAQPDATREAPAAALVPEAPAPTSKSRRKAAASGTTAAQPTVKAAAIAEGISAKPPSPVVAAVESKSAWSLDDDKKNSGTPLSLREIQELEIKKVEARKVAERERSARAATTAANPSPPVEDVQTLSWGLPTSQAGARAAKESPALSTPAVTPTTSAAANTPVWTNATQAPVVKKTMKEIQEEEEKRKKLAKDKETVAAAARRAYADSTNRVR